MDEMTIVLAKNASTSGDKNSVHWEGNTLMSGQSACQHKHRTVQPHSSRSAQSEWYQRGLVRTVLRVARGRRRASVNKQEHYRG